MSEPTNEQRADWAYWAVDNFADRCGLNNANEDMETKVSDLIADLGHLCDQYGLDIEVCVERGLGHYRDELFEEAYDRKEQANG